MTDARTPDAEPDTVADLVKAPEQPPMDDDASGQDTEIEDTDTDDLSVLGGE